MPKNVCDVLNIDFRIQLKKNLTLEFYKMRMEVTYLKKKNLTGHFNRDWVHYVDWSMVLRIIYPTVTIERYNILF